MRDKPTQWNRCRAAVARRGRSCIRGLGLRFIAAPPATASPHSPPAPPAPSATELLRGNRLIYQIQVLHHRQLVHIGRRTRARQEQHSAAIAMVDQGGKGSHAGE